MLSFGMLKSSYSQKARDACGITEIHFSNKILEVQFKRDIQKMYELYDLEGGEEQ